MRSSNKLREPALPSCFFVGPVAEGDQASHLGWLVPSGPGQHQANASDGAKVGMVVMAAFGGEKRLLDIVESNLL
jgi:hypothetical protein